MKHFSQMIRFMLIALAMLGIAVQPLHVLAACCCTLPAPEARSCCQSHAETKSCCAAKAEAKSAENHIAVKCSDPAAGREPCACCVKHPQDATVVQLQTIDVSPEPMLLAAHLPAAVSSPAATNLVNKQSVLHSGPTDHQALLCVWRK